MSIARWNVQVRFLGALELNGIVRNETPKRFFLQSSSTSYTCQEPLLASSVEKIVGSPKESIYSPLSGKG